MQRLHIFQAGTHTAMTGESVTLSEADVAATARSYNPARHEAPIVVGHPRDDGPAYGWVSDLAVQDGGLYAGVKDVDPAFADIVRAGRYRKISASFFRPGVESNPTPEAWGLRHVGFLGAVPPAVKGLKPVSLAEGAADVVAFLGAAGGGDTVDFREREARQRDAFHFCDALVDQGRLPPGLRDLAIGLLESLSVEATLSFSEGGQRVTRDQVEAFKTFLSHLPETIVFREVSAPDRDDLERAAAFAAPAGYHASGDALDLHRRAVEHQQRHGGDYAAAVRAVAGMKAG